MANKNYYYVKPKSGGKLAFRSKPADEPAEELVVEPQIAHYRYEFNKSEPTQVLDMSFDLQKSSGAAVMYRPIVGISFGRLILTTILLVILYMGGFGVYAQASSLKTEINTLATRGVTKLEDGAKALSAKDLQKATNDFTAAENLFTQAQQELLGLGQSNLYMSGLSANDFQIITGTRLVDAGLNLAQGGKALVSAMGPTFQYFNALATQPVSAQEVPAQIVGLLTTSRPQLDRAVGQIGRANELLASIDANNISGEYQDAIIQAQQKTAALEQATIVLGTLAQELPQALGFNNPRKYILLNQNSNELRATGGFIGSFSIITIHKGKIENVAVDITQRVDGQNPNPDLELPAPLRSIAVTGTFGTRDSNWYPDFPTSAKTFQKLYEEGGGGTVDGIISITPKLMESLLNFTGPIELPEKEETVTAANFVDLTQEYTQFIDNKKENPKEILAELAPIMLEKLLTLNAADLEKVNAIFLQQMHSKDITIYTRNPRLERAMQVLNFAGSMPSIGSNEDFLAVVRSNLGAKKSSGSVAHKISHTAIVNLASEVEDTIQLTSTHQGTDEFPDGTNKDYVRIYVPKGSELVGVNGQDIDTKPDVYEEDGKTVFGIWITTEPSQTRDVVIKYRPKIKISNHYSLRIFKQSGDASWLTSTLKTTAGLGIDGDPKNKSKQLHDAPLSHDMQLGGVLTKTQ